MKRFIIEEEERENIMNMYNSKGIVLEAYFGGSREKDMELLIGAESKGDSTATTRLQNILTIHSDGKFGPQTKKCLRWFQKKMNLSPDGIVGKQTADALLSNNGDSITDWATPEQIEWCRSRNPSQTA